MSRAAFGKWGLGLLGLGLVALWWSYHWGPLRPVPSAPLLRQARAALQSGRLEQAEQLARRIPSRTPEHRDALLVAGEALTKRREFQAALDIYASMPDDDSEQAIDALYCTGDILYHLGEASRAERCYRRVLSRRPHDPLSHEQLARLLTSFGRRWESLPHLLELVRQKRATVEQLLWLGNAEAVVELPANFEKFRRRAPLDPLPELALARAALARTDFAAAEKHARAALHADAALIEGWATLGRALAGGPAAAFVEWHAAVPRPAREHPDVWIARGQFAEGRAEPRVAARCFWEAVRRAPDNRFANYHLGQALLQSGATGRVLAAGFLGRAATLEELEGVMLLVYLGRDSLPHLQQASRLTETLGRLWESSGWCRAALAVDSNQAWAAGQLRRLEPLADLPRTQPGANPAASVDLSDFPLPDWKGAPARGSRQDDAGEVESTVRFEDLAGEAGIDFQYFNGSDPPSHGKLIFQTLGGGVAAIDYDGDLWPDLYLTQGAPWPIEDRAHAYVDRLYRNRGQPGFDDVTAAAGLGDRGFSHGAAAGDIDNDGFPDLYLANSGANRLYRNNGDGTFTDMAFLGGRNDARCTASCLMADLNGDGWPDLYDVTYVAAPDVYSRICSKDGQTHSCSPRLFDAEPDRLRLNRGDGSFEDVSERAGIEVPDGKGLGIVALDTTGSGRLNLFVANDTVANFYFLNQTPNESAGDSPLFREAALESGLAFDADGKAQACMGVAAGDADGDGRIDLHVTNFHDEPNTLYRQQSPDFFEDATKRFGLFEPSLPDLGFGTQFVDGDLDGWPDLVVANGHIDDFTDRGKPYQMRPKYYANRGGRRFVAIPPETIGSFFDRPVLGRSMARMDWNRDGRDDLAIMHLDVPVALLTNTSESVGHHLSLRCVATQGSRDALGATIRVAAGGRERMLQLTGGDGYMASNEKQLVFGLGQADHVDSASVCWPSGTVQVFDNLAVDRQWLLIEGRTNAVRLR